MRRLLALALRCSDLVGGLPVNLLRLGHLRVMFVTPRALTLRSDIPSQVGVPEERLSHEPKR